MKSEKLTIELLKKLGFKQNPYNENHLKCGEFGFIKDEYGDFFRIEGLKPMMGERPIRTKRDYDRIIDAIFIEKIGTEGIWFNRLRKLEKLNKK